MPRWLQSMIVTLAASTPATAQAQLAGAAPAAFTASVQGHSVTHPADAVVVRVPASTTYVGGERFTLYGVADADIDVFVDADARRRVARLYWIQFESYLPSRPERRYNYSDNRRAEVWGTVTWIGGGPRETTGPTRPGSDREHVMNILARAGYTVPPEMMNARLVQMLDDPGGTGRGRRELMLIYSQRPRANRVALLGTGQGRPDYRCLGAARAAAHLPRSRSFFSGAEIAIPGSLEALFQVVEELKTPSVWNASKALISSRAPDESLGVGGRKRKSR